jgi:fatty-acyl-CoA synthase
MRGLIMEMPLMISSFIEHAAATHGATEIVSRTIGGGIHRYDYASARTRCKRLAQALLRLGVRNGDRVGSLAWNTHHHFELFYGVSGTGAVLHTINPRLFDEQLVFIVNHAEDKWICFDEATRPLAERLAPQLSTVEGWIWMGDDGDPPKTSLAPVLSYEKLVAAEDGAFEWPQFDEFQASTICYTSGTTGAPKGVVNSHRSTLLSAFIMSTADMIGGYRAGAREAVMPIAPLFHGNGWQMVYTAPMNGHKLVLPGRNFEPDKLYELMVSEGVTLAAAVPTVWLALVDYMDARSLRFTSLRAAMVAGTKPPRALLEALEERHGVEVAQCWGMTEALGACKATISPGLVDAPRSERIDHKLRSGRIAFGSELRIVDDAGEVLPRDGQAFGHLQARGHVIAAGYLKQDKLPGGWLPTGDMARIHPDGSLDIVDRSKDVIKSGGEWISSVAIESAALDHPALAQAAVIAIPHERWQERPLLIAARRQAADVTREAVIDHLRGRMASWWLPDDVVFVDALPMTATGKVNKVVLRQQFAEQRKAAE